MLETLRLQRRTWNPVERKAEAGDQVLMEYSAEAKEGRVPEEGAERLAIIMGDSGFEDLEKAVAKIEPGESSNIKLKFPDNFRNSALAGQKAKVELKVVTVSESVIPEVDEEFITSFGVEDGTLDTLKEEIRGNLERELKQAMNTILKTRLIDALVASRADLDVPAGMVRDEASNMAMQIAARQGLEQPDPAIAQQLMGEAEKRVRAGLLMGELAQQNSIRIDGSKVRETIESIASTYEQSAEVVQMYYGNQQLLQQVESSVLEEQVVDWALENAKVTPEPMKFQDVITTATQAARGQ
jgi:trigger factor